MITIKGYEIQEKIRQYHNIDTYHALRIEDKCKVFLKIPNNHDSSSENLAILQNEFQLLNKIQADAIIKAYDFIQNTPAPVLILENVEGQLLSTYLIENQLDINDFFDLALQLVDILGELHQRNIIHKEIRPSNIIINPEKLTLKLVDLSASTRLSEEAFDNLNLSKFDEDLAYIAPEQTGRINRVIDHRTDFYSLGVTLYEMITNQLPFQIRDTMELIQSHVTKKPPSVMSIRRNIPRMLAAIISKLLEKMPEDRYSSYIGIKSDIEECYKQWLLKRNDNEYALGTKDIKDHLSISRNLYGRGKQVRQLLEAFYNVRRARSEIVFITGYSGIGKSSLVKEVQKPIAEFQGYFIQGKFDQLRRGTPYSAIVAAFQDLVKQVLSEHEDKLHSIKKQLLNSLGTIGQVIIDVIPEVELIIGKQPAIHPLNPAEAQMRFNLAFQNFVRIFAKEDHPLVLFLDDLQWADNSSLNFIENLLQDSGTKYLLIIGAYRDNEINEQHPLRLSLENLTHNKVKFTTIILEPLNIHDIQQLLQDALATPPEKTLSLVEYVFEKTQGNPFFINEFLKVMYQENLLVFSYEKGMWEWDLSAIRQKSNNGNVINLITAKINLLTQATQNTLKLAACLGHQFDFKTLLVTSGQTASQTAEQLGQAINANLIHPLEETYKTQGLIGLDMAGTAFNFHNLNYKFAHDRIQQATYELIAPQDRPQLHLKIGRLLLKENPLEEHDERLFTVLKHFNQSNSLVTDTEERHLLAKYNFWAGQKAKLEAAYYAANEHLSAGVEFLEPFNWKTNYTLTFQLLKECAVCKYLIGEFDLADHYFSELLEHSRSELEKLEIYRLKIEMFSTLGKHTEALDIGLKVLRNFKIKIPRNPNTLHILIAIYKIKFQIGKTKIEDIHLPPMEDLQQKAIVNLITQLLNSSFITNQKLFVLLTCKNISMSLKHGYTESTSMAIPVYAFIIMHSLNLYDEAVSFVELYNRLKLEYGASNFEGKNQFILGTFLEPYQNLIKDCNVTVHNAFKLCCDVGDLVYSNYSKLLIILHSMSTEKHINEVKTNIDSCLAFMSRVKISDFFNVVAFWEYSIQCLEHPEIELIQRSAHFEERIINGKNKTELSFFYSSLTRFHLVLNNFEEAINAGEKHELYSDYDKGLISHFDGKFFYALALCSCIPHVPARKRRSYLKKLKQLIVFIDKYAGWCPENYQVYSLILHAESALLNQQHEAALPLYEEAVMIALANDLTLLAAIANERAGIHCMNIKLERIAKIYLQNAKRYFKDWGAFAKVKLLEDLYPALLVTRSNAADTTELAPSPNIGTTQNLDMLAILKFTQIISDEIRLDKLLQKLLLIVLELTEAEHAIILTKLNDQWFVEAEGSLQYQHVYLNILAGDVKHKYPQTLVRYVQNTQKPIIINDALHSEPGSQDKYIQEKIPHSLLMMPLFYKGELSRMIYLENDTSHRMLMPAHLNSLQLFTDQAMNSLEHAKHFYQVTHDLLTGLANRNMLYELFHLTTKQIARTQGTIALLFVGLDSYKAIQDNLGQDVSDKILIHVAHVLTSKLREGDTAARIGGDEFAVMLANIHSQEILSGISEQLLRELSKPIQINEHSIQISASIGISQYPKDGNDIQTLLKLAETAHCKGRGKNQLYFYSK